MWDDPENDYFLVKAKTSSAVLDKDETDKWGARYTSGTSVIRGSYFQQQDNPLCFRLVKRKPALVPSQSVLYMCTSFEITDDIVSLSEDTHQAILKCVSESTYFR